MKTLTRKMAQVLLLMVGCLAAGCQQGPAMVANPDYEAWQAFEPGSYVVFDGTHTDETETRKLRLTRTLVSKDDEGVVLEQRVEVWSGGQAESNRAARRAHPARIDREGHYRTHPASRILDRGEEDVATSGRELRCRVEDLELKAVYEGFVGTTEELRARAWSNSSVPGGLVKVEMAAKTKTHESHVKGQVVDYKALKAQER